MSGDAARRGGRWWEALSTDGPHAEEPDVTSLADPWLDHPGSWNLTLSDEQRAFLIGEIDQPAPPRLRTLDVSYEIHDAPAEDASNPTGTTAGKRAGKRAGNATGKVPGDGVADDPYGRST